MTDVVPGAASALLIPMVNGAARQCEVIIASRTAIHAQTGDERVPLLSIIAPGGARLPGAVVLALPMGGVWAAVRSADHLLVGDGQICGTDFAIHIRRWWSPQPVRLPTSSGELIRGATALHPYVGERTRSSLQAYGTPARGESIRPAAVLEGLVAGVGLGPGLTPESDDVLAGALVTWQHLARTGRWPGADLIMRRATDLLPMTRSRTTAVSAALLSHAGNGESFPELHALLAAWRTPALIGDRLESLVRIGHTTGCALALGVSLAAATVLSAGVPGRLAS